MITLRYVGNAMWAVDGKVGTMYMFRSFSALKAVEKFTAFVSSFQSVEYYVDEDSVDKFEFELALMYDKWRKSIRSNYV